MDRHALKTRLRQGARIGARVAEIAAQVSTRSPLGLASLVMTGTDALIKEFEPSPWSIFIGAAWTPYPSSNAFFVVDAMRNDPERKLLAMQNESIAYQVPAPGGGFIGAMVSDNAATIYTRDLSAPAIDVLGRYIWEHLGSSLALDVNEGNASIRPDPLTFKAPTQDAEHYLEQLRAYVKAGEPVSMLLYGEPGVGKSTLARTMAHELHGTTLRLRADRLEHYAGFLIGILALMRPTVVIMDDLDHADESLMLIGSMESMRQHVSVILATANDLSDFHGAILRPGRFDMVEHVTQDPKATQALLDQLDAETAQLAAHLPISHLYELVRVRRLIGRKATHARAELYVSAHHLQSPTQEHPDDPSSPGFDRVDPWPDPDGSL